MTESKTFVGRPVTGEIITRPRGRLKQKGPADFKAALDTLLSSEHVTGVLWEQYTPYFNDGDACVFRVYEAYVSLDIPSTAYPELQLSPCYQVEIDGSPLALFEPWDLTSALPATRQALAAFNSDLDSYEEVLYGAFGDHARVYATPEGFQVWEYDHD